MALCFSKRSVPLSQHDARLLKHPEGIHTARYEKCSAVVRLLQLADRSQQRNHIATTGDQLKQARLRPCSLTHSVPSLAQRAPNSVTPAGPVRQTSLTIYALLALRHSHSTVRSSLAEGGHSVRSTASTATATRADSRTRIPPRATPPL